MSFDSIKCSTRHEKSHEDQLLWNKTQMWMPASSETFNKWTIQFLQTGCLHDQQSFIKPTPEGQKFADLFTADGRLRPQIGGRCIQIGIGSTGFEPRHALWPAHPWSRFSNSIKIEIAFLTLSTNLMNCYFSEIAETIAKLRIFDTRCWQFQHHRGLHRKYGSLVSCIGWTLVLIPSYQKL